MSYSIAVNIFFDEPEPLHASLKVLSAVSRVYREHGGASQQFSRVRICDKELSVKKDFYPPTGTLKEVIDFVERNWSEDVFVWIDSAYPFLSYEKDVDATVPDERPLDIRFYGANYEGGFYRKAQGHVEITFDNMNSFLGTSVLNQKLARPETVEDMSRWSAMLVEVVRNYDYVRRLIQTVIKEAQPRHVLSCTESYVNPLVSHDIYHSRLEDFGADLMKIAKLHEHGGVYFADLQTEDRAFLPTWKRDTYGYWRGRYGRNNSEELTTRLQPYVDWLLKNGQTPQISNEVIEKCLMSSRDTQFERVGEGYLISCRASSLYYIEQPYFCLFDRVMQERQ